MDLKLHGCGCFAEGHLYALDLEGCLVENTREVNKMLATAFKGLSVASSSSVLGGRPCQPGTTHRPLPLQRSPVCPSIEAAHKKGGGSTKNGRYGGTTFWTWHKPLRSSAEGQMLLPSTSPIGVCGQNDAFSSSYFWPSRADCWTCVQRL